LAAALAAAPGIDNPPYPNPALVPFVDTAGAIERKVDGPACPNAGLAAADSANWPESMENALSRRCFSQRSFIDSDNLKFLVFGGFSPDPDADEICAKA
jgi:hypothetical protein